MDLTLNLFRARLEPESLLLPVCACGSWEESTVLLKGRLKKYQVVRTEQTDRSVRVIAISGPTTPEDMASENVNLLQDSGVASRIIRTAIDTFFANEGMLIERDRFDTLVCPSASESVSRHPILANNPRVIPINEKAASALNGGVLFSRVQELLKESAEESPF